jgi:hypothetical protein
MNKYQKLLAQCDYQVCRQQTQPVRTDAAPAPHITTQGWERNMHVSCQPLHPPLPATHSVHNLAGPKPMRPGSSGVPAAHEAARVTTPEFGLDIPY